MSMYKVNIENQIYALFETIKYILHDTRITYYTCDHIILFVRPSYTVVRYITLLYVRKFLLKSINNNFNTLHFYYFIKQSNS